jgi:diadenosine tetraphosphatase ApaH/serine/threonine PP2A family protein phosphatase
MGKPTGPLAVLADIHGNSWALDAVLADARHHGATRFVNLGDCAFGPLDPAGTMSRLRELDATTIRGNEDEVAGDHPTVRYVRDQVGADDLEWLSSLPATATLDGEILLCHGTPSSNTTYLLETVGEHGARERPVVEVSEMLDGVAASLVLCGHSHVPRLVELPGGRRVCNPGSVGLPAYDDDVPYPHVMSSGSPHARYVLLHRDGDRRRVEQRVLPYDWSRAARAARERDREDWARALETGRA